MRWIHYLLVIVITIIVAVVVVIWMPGSGDDSGASVVPPATGVYHTWLYIDKIAGKVALTDIAGNELVHEIVTYKGDELIFVNRSNATVDVSFASVNIFGAGNENFSLAPEKRARKAVVGSPGGYAFTLEAGSGPIGPPKVKVGTEP